MKREFLTGLGVDVSVIDQIMSENGKDIEGLKAQLNVQKGLVSDLTTQLNTASSSLEGYKKLDVDGITKERDSYKAQYEQALKDKDTAVAKVKYDGVLDSALGKYKFTSSFAKNGIREALSNKQLKLKDDKLEGFEDTMKELIETHKDAFIVEDTKKPMFTSSVQSRSDNVSDKEYLASKYKDNPWANVQ